MNSKNRLLGIVRFYDENKGFGFIYTNGLGIDSINSRIKSSFIELFFTFNDFCSQDIMEGAFVHRGDWVSFDFKKSNGGKRDYAKKVRLFRYTEEDLTICLEYKGYYSNIWDKQTDVFINVFQSLSLGFILKGTKRIQLVFEKWIEAYKEDPSSIVNHVLKEEQLLQFLLSKNNSSITVKDTSTYECLLSDISQRLFEMALSEFHSSTRIDLFATIVRQMSPQYLAPIRKYICTEVADSQYSLKTIQLLKELSIDAFDQLFGSDNYDSPIIRMIGYNRLSKASIIQHESMIEYWNTLASKMDDPFKGINVNPHIKLPSIVEKEISTVIAESQSASDELLLMSFITYSNIECYNKIKDKTIILTWLPKLDDQSISLFLNHCKDIPDANTLFQDFLNTLGVTRLSRIATKYNDSFFDSIPYKKIIKITALLYLIREERIEEISWRGGYWTWGEGVRNERCNKNTYLIKHYLAKSYLESDNNQLINSDSSNLVNKDEIEKQIIQCIESKRTTTYFPYYLAGNIVLAVLTLRDTINNNYDILFRHHFQIKTMINTKGKE